MRHWNGGVQQVVTYTGGKPQRVGLGGDRCLWYLKPGEWVRSSQRQHRGRRAERGQRQSLRKRPADQGEREQLLQCWPAEKPKKEDTVSTETLCEMVTLLRGHIDEGAQPVKCATLDLRAVSSSPMLGSTLGMEPTNK